MTGQAGPLLRHLRAATGLSQRRLAERAAVAKSTAADLESDRAPASAVDRLVEAVDWQLAAFPQPTPDAQRDLDFLRHLYRHPIDRAELCAREDGLERLGLHPQRWIELLDTMTRSLGGVVIVGAAALQFWLPPDRPKPTVHTLDVVIKPAADPHSLARFRDSIAALDPMRLQVFSAPHDAALPRHVCAASIPLNLAAPRGVGVLSPRDLLLTRAWSDDLARLVLVDERTSDRDAGARHEPAHRTMLVETRSLTWSWPARRRQGRRPYRLPPRALRRRGPTIR